MRFNSLLKAGFLKIGAILMLFAGLSAAETQPTKHSSSANHSPTRHTSHRHRTRRGAWKRRGQQEIKSDRAVEIQQALIREKYLDGTPSGEWDSRTQQAMARYQADHGWQSKVTPDSRALIKLGLGPSHAQDIVNTDPRTDSVAANASSTSGLTANTPNRR